MVLIVLDSSAKFILEISLDNSEDNLSLLIGYSERFVISSNDIILSYKSFNYIFRNSLVYVVLFSLIL